MVQYNNGRKLLCTEHVYGSVFKGQRFVSFGTNSLYLDLLPSWLEKDQNNVQCVYQLITSLFINPFSDNMELISLSSELTPTERAVAGMLEADYKGEYFWRICWRTAKVHFNIKFSCQTYWYCFRCISWNFDKECRKRPSQGWKITFQEDHRKSIPKAMGILSIKWWKQNWADTIFT